MINKLLFFALVIAIFLLNLITCKKSGTSPAEKEYVMPDSNIVFMSDSVNHISELFRLKCGSWSECHSPVSPPNNLDLTDYNLIHHTIENVGQLVLLGNGEGSPLYQILFPGTSVSIELGRMPPNGPYLNENQTYAVKEWIDNECPYDMNDLK